MEQLAKYVKEKTYTLCGTPLYIAPEVILNRGHDKGADHWSLACMIYEMMYGATPFFKDGMDQISLFRAVVQGKFQFPKSCSYSEDFKSLIKGMLEVVPNRRLGSLAGGSQDIYRASWFSSIHFSKLKRKLITAPWIPKINDPLDSSNFENWDHLQDKTKMKDPPISKKEEAIFLDF
jgi:serine/threonine protein kinase